MKSRKLALLAATGAAATLCTLILAPTAVAQKTDARSTAAEFVLSEAQFDDMFPNRNSFYTYSGLTAALSAYPDFANAGSDTVKKQEAAAFLANVSHETG
ncbi:MAG TPA: chitinase, partial [Streptomyces sp.]|nr:chitinase [Streptomyces sp.]